MYLSKTACFEPSVAIGESSVRRQQSLRFEAHRSNCQYELGRRRREPRLSIACFLLLAVLIFCGCSGPAIEADADGRKPGDVVLAAYEAAISDDFDKANSFGTPSFVKHEESMRKAIEEGRMSADTPSAAWTNRVADITDVSTLSIEEERWSKGFPNIVIVKLVTPKGNTQIEVTKLGNQWKLASGEDRGNK